MSNATQDGTDVVYKAKVLLGAPALDKRAGIAGHVYGITFHPKDCVDVLIQWFKDGEQKINFVPVERFVEENVPASAEDQEFRTNIEPDQKYRDSQTGLEGWASSITFFDHMATRVDLRRLSEKEGMQKVTYSSVDDFLLVPVDVPKVELPDPPKKSSPVIKEERYR